MKRSKYTRGLLGPIIRDSISWAEVLRRLGVSFTGGNNDHVKKKVRELGIDTSHFLGLRANSGNRHKGGHKLTGREVLVLDRTGTGRKERLSILRRALCQLGMKNECKKCGLGSEWNGTPLTLHIDHVNGNPVDNRKKNLRYLCPNCHSQTETYAKCKKWSNQYKTGMVKPTGRTKRRIRKNVNGIPISTFIPK